MNEVQALVQDMIPLRDEGVLTPWEQCGGGFGYLRSIRTLVSNPDDVLLMVMTKAAYSLWAVYHPSKPILMAGGVVRAVGKPSPQQTEALTTEAQAAADAALAAFDPGDPITFDTASINEVTLTLLSLKDFLDGCMPLHDFAVNRQLIADRVLKASPEQILAIREILEEME